MYLLSPLRRSISISRVSELEKELRAIKACQPSESPAGNTAIYSYICLQLLER